MSRLLTEAEWAEHRRTAIAMPPPTDLGGELPDVFLAYQKELLASTSTHALTVTDKSRRIGATWAFAADAVLTSASDATAGGMDTLYLGYNLDMAREFIDTCAMWAKAFNSVCTEVGEFLFTEEGEDGAEKSIQAFRIRFASGYEIVALSSKPRSLRGRQGYVILDEFAFHEDAEGLLKAAMALLIWGGKVLVISTHNGADNPFNLLIQEIREGKRPGNIVRCTFDDALEQGLYQRICLKNGKTWSPEGEAKWRAEIRASYGDDAAEELDCIPAQGTGVYLTRAQIEACMSKDIPVVRLTCPSGFAMQSDDERESYVEAWLEQEVKPLLDALNKDRCHYFGQDFARLVDLSVIVPLQELPDLTLKAPFILEQRDVPFREQEQVLKYVVDRLPRFIAGKIDATGNGLYLGERAVQAYGSAFEAVMLSEAWYLANMPKMKSRFEDRTILLPMDAETLDDLRKIKTVRGIPKVPRDERSASQGGGKRHGDAAVAIALAIAAANSEPVEFAYHSVQPRSPLGGGAYDPDDEDDDSDGARGGSMRGLRGTGAL